MLAAPSGTGDRLTAVDADPEPELRPPAGVQFGETIAERERRAYRALGVVVMGTRHPEHRHDRVADELLDRAAMLFEDLAQRAEGAAERRTHYFRIVRR